MLNRSYIGKKFQPYTVRADKSQLRLFTKAIGETNPVYVDEKAAKSAGYSSILAPPTFIACLSVDHNEIIGKLTAIGADLAKVLHAGQKFEYFAPVCADDEITFESKYIDMYDKKGGALEFVVEETIASNHDGDVVCKFTQTVVVRNT